jgi:hypothetical protein
MQLGLALGLPQQLRRIGEELCKYEDDFASLRYQQVCDDKNEAPRCNLLLFFNRLLGFNSLIQKPSLLRSKLRGIKPKDD